MYAKKSHATASYVDAQQDAEIFSSNDFEDNYKSRHIVLGSVPQMYTREHVKMNRKQQICETTDTSEFLEGQEGGVDKPVKVVMVDIEDLLVADGIEVVDAKGNHDNMASYSIFKEWFATRNPADREYDSSNFKTCNTPVVSDGSAAEKAVKMSRNDESGCC